MATPRTDSVSSKDGSEMGVEKADAALSRLHARTASAPSMLLAEQGSQKPVPRAVLARGLVDTHPGNQFRSNVEFHEKPRQLIVLGGVMAVMMYFAYAYKAETREDNIRASCMVVAATFLMHCFLQCRDTVIIRPHPGVWRVVHGLGMLYFMAMAIILVHDKRGARELVRIFFDDVGDPSKPRDPSEPFQDCSLNLQTLYRQVTEIWFLAHAFGWWGKMVMFRDWGVCWFLSIGFEMLECTLQFIIPEFRECWWDSLFIDLFGANLLGMVAGWYTLKVVETHSFDWAGTQGHRMGRIRRFVSRLSPYSFTRYRWHMFSSFQRFLQVMALVVVCLTMELNAFMLLHTLQIPKPSAFNKARLCLIALLAIPSAAEYYDFLSNPGAVRLGPNAWCMIAVMLMEIVVWLKFWPSNFVVTTPPPDVRYPWICTISMLLLWAFITLVLVKDEDVIPQTELATPRSGEKKPKEVTNGPRSPGKTARTRKDVTAGVVQEMADMFFFLAFIPLVWLVKQWAWE